MGRLLRCKHTDSLRCLFSRTKSLSEPVIIIIIIIIILGLNWNTRGHYRCVLKNRFFCLFVCLSLPHSELEFAEGAVVSVFRWVWIYINQTNIWHQLAGSGAFLWLRWISTVILASSHSPKTCPSGCSATWLVLDWECGWLWSSGHLFIVELGGWANLLTAGPQGVLKFDRGGA